mmetsp:Transcript_7956/g.19804  ORF Transcript_7956/g.19804 Transcript_7956/m.19804 type:complete len:80 (-) Transcript_7956:5-244(-)
MQQKKRVKNEVSADNTEGLSVSLGREMVNRCDNDKQGMAYREMNSSRIENCSVKNGSAAHRTSAHRWVTTTATIGKTSR